VLVPIKIRPTIPIRTVYWLSSKTEITWCVQFFFNDLIWYEYVDFIPFDLKFINTLQFDYIHSTCIHFVRVFFLCAYYRNLLIEAALILPQKWQPQCLTYIMYHQTSTSRGTYNSVYAIRSIVSVAFIFWYVCSPGG
jgi:hypothetical protein